MYSVCRVPILARRPCGNPPEVLEKASPETDPRHRQVAQRHQPREKIQRRTTGLCAGLENGPSPNRALLQDETDFDVRRPAEILAAIACLRR